MRFKEKRRAPITPEVLKIFVNGVGGGARSHKKVCFRFWGHLLRTKVKENLRKVFGCRSSTLILLRLDISPACHCILNPEGKTKTVTPWATLSLWTFLNAVRRLSDFLSPVGWCPRWGFSGQRQAEKSLTTSEWKTNLIHTWPFPLGFKSVTGNGKELFPQ